MYIADKTYIKGDAEKKPDYGWRYQGNRVILHKDHSIKYDESAHNMEETLRETSAEYYFLDKCLQCGICTASCPYSSLDSNDGFSPREFVQKLRLGLTDFSGEDLWFCTNCGSCVAVCPYEVPLVDVIIGLRKLVVSLGAGYVPSSIRTAASSLSGKGNLFGEGAANRITWSNSIDETSQAPGTEEMLLFMGCFPSYDNRSQKMAYSAISILEKAGIGFGFLSDKEVCCGDVVLRTGNFKVFEKLKDANKSNIREKGIKDIYTLSPHCFDIMKNHYFNNDEPQFSVKPFILLLRDILEKGLLKFKRSIDKKISYHDPCFLSKHNSIIEEPREILKSLPGVKLVEMEHSGAKSMCCGGGGGGILLDRKKEQRLSGVRLSQFLQTGADILVTACPYCLSMFDDAAKNSDHGSDFEILDLTELILRAL